MVYAYDGYYSTIKMNELDTHNRLADSQMLSERIQEKNSLVHAYYSIKEHFRKCELICSDRR